MKYPDFERVLTNLSLWNLFDLVLMESYQGLARTAHWCMSWKVLVALKVICCLHLLKCQTGARLVLHVTSFFVCFKKTRENFRNIFQTSLLISLQWINRKTCVLWMTSYLEVNGKNIINVTRSALLMSPVSLFMHISI